MESPEMNKQINELTFTNKVKSDSTVFFRCSLAEKKQLEELAKSRNMTVSDYLKQAVNSFN